MLLGAIFRHRLMAVICSCAQENLGSVRRTCTDVRARGTKRRIVLLRRQNETRGDFQRGVAFMKIGNPRGESSTVHKCSGLVVLVQGGGNERERRERARAPGTVREWDLWDPWWTTPAAGFLRRGIAGRPPPHLQTSSFQPRDHRSPFD